MRKVGNVEHVVIDGLYPRVDYNLHSWELVNYHPFDILISALHHQEPYV